MCIRVRPIVRINNVCIVDMQGGKPSCHISDMSVAPTVTKGRASTNDIHVICRVKEIADDQRM